MSLHVGIIPDGNRRWAKQQLLNPLKGHEEGVKKIFLTMEWFLKREDISELSIFLLSTENYVKRSKKEIDHLEKIGLHFLEVLVEKYKGKIVLNVAGIKDNVKQDLKQKIDYAVSSMQTGSKKLNLLLNYGGRREIIEAVNSLLQENERKVDESIFKRKLWVSSDVDIVIRTGKEYRISNFLIFQSAYAEFFFLDMYWPEITEQTLNQVMEDFYARERRFGK
ncbi:MAG: di-trans,poly-cis-decaprenylcistransferase [Candidatus Nanohaloarchaeota archaeon]|nr:di-trans,poly-cis-decaprenylcistransferase [Candidatus Nanohaloarchaeota archaeon]